MRNAFSGIIFPCLQTANLTLNLRNHTSQLVTCLKSVLEGIRLGLESAAADSLNCRGSKKQRHHLIGGRLVIFDLLEITQKMDPALLRLVVLLVGEGGVCDRDHSNFTPLEMSRGKTQCHIVTLVCQDNDCVSVCQRGHCCILNARLQAAYSVAEVRPGLSRDPGKRSGDRPELRDVSLLESLTA